MLRYPAFACLLACVALTACSDDTSPSPEGDAGLDGSAGDTGSDAGSGAGAPCVPDQAAWDSGVGALVDLHCGTCHGPAAAFGAPFSLTTFADATRAYAATAVNETIAREVAAGEMPPPWASPAAQADLDAIYAWATCDPDAVAPERDRLEVTAPVLQAPPLPPAGATAIDLLAPEFAVGPDVRNLYQCFTFELDIDAEQFVRRLEFVLDQDEVIHHIVLLRDPDGNAPDDPHLCYGMPAGSQYAYAWAPGGGAVDFGEGGVRVAPGERFVLQLHYHNGQGIPDVFDSSGVRLWVTEPVGAEYGMIALGPLGFGLPAGTTTEAAGQCPISEPSQLFASMPHMHTLGSAFEQVVERADGSEDVIIGLTGWSFDVQRFYSTPVALRPGDTVRTTCTFVNTSDQMVTSGEDTEQEMCFNFAYITPPPSDRYCDQAVDTETLDYTPGECADAAALTAPAQVTVNTVLGVPEVPATAGAPADGRYELRSGTLWVSQANLVGNAIDFDASYVLGRGQIWIDNGTFHYDARTKLVAYFEDGTSFDSERTFTFSGALTTDDAGQATVARDCPAPGDTAFRYIVDGDALEFIATTNEAGATFTAWYRFERAP